MQEVIEIAAHRARLNVEIKAPAADWPVLAPKLAELLGARRLLDATIISCFEPAALMVVRDCAAGAQLGLLWQRPDVSEAWEWARALRPVSFHPHWALVSAATVEAAHVRALQVLTWTVNDADAMRNLVAQGVDGIISDFPERFVELNDCAPR